MRLYRPVTVKTAHHHVRIVDEGQHRVLYFAGNPQSQVVADAPAEGGLEYAGYVHAAWALAEHLGRVLVVGLGGGSLPMQFVAYYPGVRVEVVELDGEVVSLAQEYFGVTFSDRLQVTIAEAREYLVATHESYDLIFMDAYLNDRHGRLLIPPHLTTVEFFQLLERRLTPTGWLCYNVTGELTGRDSRMPAALLTTMAQVFPHRCAFDMDQDANLMLFANRHQPVPTKAELGRRIAVRQEQLAAGHWQTADWLAHYHWRGLPDSEHILRDPGAEVPRLMGCRDFRTTDLVFPSPGSPANGGARA